MLSKNKFLKFISYVRLINENPFYTKKDKKQLRKILFQLSSKKALYPNKEPVEQNIFGFKMKGLSYSRLLFLFNEVFVSGEYYFESEKKQPLIIDCGANLGMATIFFKKLYPHCKIIAFEPNPFVFELLEHNIKHNNIENVELHNCALSDAEGRLSFYYNQEKDSLLGSLRADRGGNNAVDVDCKLLSSIIGEDQYDLIKIDVEGAEDQIVRDLISQKALGRSKQYLVEYHHKINKEQAKLAGFLDSFESVGFDYNLSTTAEGKGEFQDILIHFYNDHSES